MTPKMIRKLIANFRIANFRIAKSRYINSDNLNELYTFVEYYYFDNYCLFMKFRGSEKIYVIHNDDKLYLRHDDCCYIPTKLPDEVMKKFDILYTKIQLAA